MPVAPPTAYPTGTRLTVGSHEVEIGKFIGEGGFAHVYTVSTTPVIPGHEVACLKRVQVPNKAYLNLLRAEVDAMQRLKGASNIVQYFDSHAERMHDLQAQGQYEVFLLMEYCERGGLIDFMNTRLRDRLRENEILKIMYDITLGLAHMHYLVPALLHRDLKIENVLITGDGTFKLCDFGSVSPVLRPPKTPQEFQILEDDIQHHTTVQYRAPEMVAIARGHPIDEKSDIWALGIFLYKLCYYTTPFERPNQTLEQFQQLILSGLFTIPPRPAYSERLRNMIRVLLQPDPRLRPNVFQVMQEICAMRRVDCPIKDIYNRQTQQLPQMPPQQPGQDMAGAPMPPQQQLLPTSSGFSQNMPNGMPFPQSIPPGQGLSMPAAGQQYQHQQLHLQQSLPPQPAPGQVPVPGVLLTSPMMTPTSPKSRPVSPLDDEDQITARYPPLEELDLVDASSSLVDLEDSQMSQPPKPRSLKPQLPMPMAHTQVQKPQQVQQVPPIPAKQPINDSYDYAMPKRPQRNSREVVRTVNNVGGSSSGEQDEPVPILPPKPPSAEAAKLKQILTGISGKSSTVRMDTPQEKKDLSSVDFLKTLQTPAEGSQHRHHSIHHAIKGKRSRKTSLHKNYYHENDNDGDDDNDEHIDDDGAYVRTTLRSEGSRQEPSDKATESDGGFEEYEVDEQYNLNLSDARRSKDDESFNFSDADSISPLASPTHIVPVSPPKTSLVKQPVTPKPALDGSPKGSDSASSTLTTLSLPPKVTALAAKPKLDIRKHYDGKPFNQVATTPLVGTMKPRPKSMLIGRNELASQTDTSLDTFKPSNSIQQRVHSFLSGHDRQHPTRRTAKGYGRFTDAAVEYHGSDGDGSDDSEVEDLKARRTRSLGTSVPPAPPKTSKPKVKQ